MSELKFHAIPNGATHFIQSTGEDRDHFVRSDEFGNVSAVFCPDYAFLGWDSDIEIEPISVNALPLSYYKEIIRKDAQIKKLTDRVEWLHSNLIVYGWRYESSSQRLDTESLLAEIKGENNA